jgi:hypothetical protein
VTFTFVLAQGKNIPRENRPNIAPYVIPLTVTPTCKRRHAISTAEINGKHTG